MKSPLLTYFGMIRRLPHLVEMYRPDAQPIQSYQFWGAGAIDDAYGDPAQSGVGGSGPDSMFTVVRNGSYRSPTLKRRGLGFYESNRRGQTTVFFGPEDFTGPGSAIGLDSEWLFLRIQESRSGLGLLDYPDVPEATVTLATVAATDQLIVKGVYFEFVAGANNLVGKAGSAGDPFLVGLGADDDAAAANLTAALNDDGDVSPVMDALAPLNTRTFATNVGAPSAVVLIQPEDSTGALVPGSSAAFAISTPDDPRVGLDASSAAAGTLVYSADDPTNPVLGPIYCIPPAIFMSSREPALLFSGTAPATTGSSAGALPNLSDDFTDASPRPLHLVFPMPLSSITVTNTGGSALLVSFGAQSPMVSVAAGAEVSFFTARVKEVLLASPGAATTYRLAGVMGLGA